ncbi:MAG TPA: methyltransferase domain-containing protein [Pseudolabrys sp.]|nr:methyltransferase domain-containing protein [Pseudolabrys sp.]
MSIQLQVDRLLSATSGDRALKLQLGCGTNILPGWINTDIEPSPTTDYLDFSKPFPFPNNTISAVFCEHTIEHLPKATGLYLISEAFRVLKPGGQFRIVTPSLEKICELSLHPDTAAASKYIESCRRLTRDPSATIGDAINLIFYGHGHKHIYRAEELADFLVRTGFVTVRIMDPGVYGHHVFNGVDGHGKIIGEDVNAMEAMAVEAAKP